MNDSTFDSFEAALADEQFPEVDLMLRRGCHIGRDHGALYGYLVDAQSILEPFYRRFGCELVQKNDGYYYLLPSGDRLGRRQLSPGEMLVGQTLALLYLDPATVQHGGTITRELLLQRLSGLLGSEVLVRTLSPRKRRYDERIATETVRVQIGEAVRRLAALGFIDIADDTRLRLRSALMRFAEPVRGLSDLNTALEKLVAHGQVVLAQETDEEDADSEDEANGDEEVAP